MKNILINFPSNLGDAIIGLPALNRLRSNYSQAKITAIVSSKTKEFLLRNNFIDEVVVFDKSWRLKQKINFTFNLRHKYDLIVDFKNTFLPVVLAAKKRTPFLRRFPKEMHAKDEYLALIRKVAPRAEGLQSEFILKETEKNKWQRLRLDRSIFIACSSREKLKRYPYEYLRQVIAGLHQVKPLVILGQSNDRTFYKDILTMKGVIDLVGKTTMSDVFYLLKNYSSLLLCVDSSIMQLASYLNLPIVALFGCSNPFRYGPWSKKSIILQKKDTDIYLTLRRENYSALLERMKIEPKRVLEAVKKMLEEV